MVPQGITVGYNQLFRNGVQWQPKGVTVIAFKAPVAVAGANSLAGRLTYGVGELNVARSLFGADMIRFQISQPGLDPQSTIYDPAYLTEIVTAVSLALSKNFTVMLSMEAQSDSGLAGLPCMPTDSTVRAWQTIAPSFASNGNVLLELYNEPCEADNAQGIIDWVSSHQPIVTALRTLGSTNVLVLDGLNFARYFGGLVTAALTDTIPNRRMFGVHPYFAVGNLTSTDWDANFGYYATIAPMMGAEWLFFSGGCLVGTPTDAANLMAYLATKRMGLVGWSIDYPQTMVHDDVSYVPTNYIGFTACGDASNTGAGDAFTRWPAP